MNIEEKRRLIIDFIRKHPNTTYRDIRKNIKIHPERVFKNGIKEAFEIARVIPPRTFDIKTQEQKRRIIIEYIRKNPRVGGHTIRKDTKINFYTLFKDINSAYKEAGVLYPREIDNRRKEEKIKEIINYVKNNPLITLTEIQDKAKVNPYNFFKNIKEIYKIIGNNKIKLGEKRGLRKKQKIIEFIKNNPLATQREINKVCKTKVQELFENGIFEAYNLAEVQFPYERLKLYGTVLKNIRQRAINFEENIAKELSGYGNVNRLIKTKRGIADIIFERKDKKAIIEVKDYEAKEISISQIKQLNRYLEDCECNLGFLICIKKSLRDKFLIGKNQIFILESSEISKIPEIMGP